MKASLLWITPNAFNVVAQCARVSNPANETNWKTAPRLLRYLVEHGHWSPLEMSNACVYLECPRDISRQILRHRSFSFQEFSGRYAEVPTLNDNREVRLQDNTNRQNSLSTEDNELRAWWDREVKVLADRALGAYKQALGRGVAKEVARSLLPEGLTPSRLYMNGTLRSWVHYWNVRCTPETQKEHREVAELTRTAVLDAIPELREILG